jgi:hypothetical protein
VRRQGHATRKFGDKFGPIPIRQRFEFFDQLLGGVRHRTSVPRCALHVKFVVDSEA